MKLGESGRRTRRRPRRGKSGPLPVPVPVPVLVPIPVFLLVPFPVPGGGGGATRGVSGAKVGHAGAEDGPSRVDLAAASVGAPPRLERLANAVVGGVRPGASLAVSAPEALALAPALGAELPERLADASAARLVVVPEVVAQGARGVGQGVVRARGGAGSTEEPLPADEIRRDVAPERQDAARTARHGAELVLVRDAGTVERREMGPRGRVVHAKRAERRAKPLRHTRARAAAVCTSRDDETWLKKIDY